MKIHIIPRPGSIVRDPVTGQVLPAEGVHVSAPLSPHWKRRLREGGITLALAAVLVAAPVAPPVIPVADPEPLVTETRIARKSAESK